MRQPARRHHQRQNGVRQIEILAKEIEILNPAATPPFMIDDENISETVRLQNRVIDLRRPVMQRNLRRAIR